MLRAYIRKISKTMFPEEKAQYYKLENSSKPVNSQYKYQ